MTQGKQGLLSWCSAILILCISSYSLHSPRGLHEFSEYHTHMQAKRREPEEGCDSLETCSVMFILDGFCCLLH